MGAQINLGGASALPSAALLESAIRRLSRHDLEALTEQLIDRLDVMDPDPDIEPNGDELDGSLGEDDFHSHNESSKGAPGCPLADPDCTVDDSPCDEDADLEPDVGKRPCLYGEDQRKVLLPSPVGPQTAYRHN